jgi:hypothetical protein
MLRSQPPFYSLINCLQMEGKRLLTKKKDWFKLKRYPHIGFPLKAKDRNVWIENYITNKDKIGEHSFLPFIHKKNRVRKFRKEYSDKTGELLYRLVDGKKKVRQASKPKERELFYAAHLDALVYSYYAEILTEKYENLLEKEGLTEVVTAYRKIPVTSKSNKNKCNIDFASDVFSAINSYPDNYFVVIAFDIKGFFDNLNHKLLRENWKRVLEIPDEPFPIDHFNIYKNITRYSYIDLVDIFKEFQNNIFVNSTKYNKPSITRKRISKIKFLKKSDAIAFCTKEEFLTNKHKLIKKVKFVKNEKGETITKDFGIPQGSPISAILANLYMIDFDKKINEYLLNINGLYRRYSDDMVVICPLDKKNEIIDKFNFEIDEIKLSIQTKKTQIFHFKRQNDILFCGQEFPEGINYNKSFVYLGLEYDGSIIKIKSASVSGYYRKMKRTIRRSKHFSNKPFHKYSGELFKSRLLKRFTVIGSKRRRKYIWNTKKKYFEISHHFDWGNFISYAKKAERIKLPNRIKSQTKRHWNTLNKLLNH